MPREFHDLAEAEALNHESGGRTCWGNLGDWQAADSYPQACAALADRLAVPLRLGAHSRLLEVGFGCGDALLHWRERYGLRHMGGINLSASQTRLARQRLAQAGDPDSAARLLQGDAGALRQHCGPGGALQDLRADTVLALDCAYHFGCRGEFIVQAGQLLAPGGRLGLTDILLARPRLGTMEQLALRAVARLSHLPAVNLQTAEAYRATWQSAGFEIETFEDITDQVFQPFGDWLARYRAQLDPALERRIGWTKYRVTAAFLRWAAQQDVLRYVVCVGRRRGPGVRSGP